MLSQIASLQYGGGNSVRAFQGSLHYHNCYITSEGCYVSNCTFIPRPLTDLSQISSTESLGNLSNIVQINIRGNGQLASGHFQDIIREGSSGRGM